MNNITRSILYSYLNPHSESGQAWPVELANILRHRSNIQFLSGKKGVHAELKIMQHLYDKTKFKSTSRYYVGISKRCCFNCEHVVKAINKTKNAAIIEVRDGGHLNHYKGGIPDFLKNSDSIRHAFLNIMREQNLNVKRLEDTFHKKPKLKKIKKSKQEHARSKDKSSRSFKQQKKSKYKKAHKKTRADISLSLSSSTLVPEKKEGLPISRYSLPGVKQTLNQFHGKNSFQFLSLDDENIAEDESSEDMVHTATQISTTGGKNLSQQSLRAPSGSSAFRYNQSSTVAPPITKIKKEKEKKSIKITPTKYR